MIQICSSLFKQLLLVISNIYYYKEMRAYIFILIANILILTHNEAILDGYPITFTMAGTTTFTPDAGGSQQNGYVINLGYTGRSWIAA
jgi:hypothetical protein